MTIDEYEIEVERQLALGKRIVVIDAEGLEEPKAVTKTVGQEKVEAIKRIRELDKLSKSKESLATKTRNDCVTFEPERKAKYEERADQYDKDALTFTTEAKELRKKWGIING